jgi:hypothetical protein
MLYNIIEDAEQAVREWLNENAELVSADRVGLDRRAGSVWVSKDAIIVESYGRGSLEYYGGFEYVDKECRTQVGSLTIYYSEDDRVQDCIDRFYGVTHDEDEE